MFEDYLKPYASNPEEVSAKASFTVGNNNAQSSDLITPESAIQNFLSGGASSKEIDWETPWLGSDECFFSSDRLLPNNSAFLALLDSNSISQPENLSVDSLTGKALSPTLEQAFTSASNHIQALASDPYFNTKMNLAFGTNWDAEEAKELFQELAQGDAMPAIVILSSSEINGANGAFASVTNTIYLSSEFIVQNAVNPEAITSVVIEEIGHYIDSRINQEDAAGDEGAIFSALVQGKTLDEPELLALKAEDDTALITLDGKVIQIEQDDSFSTARNIGYLSGTQTFSDGVGSVDYTDCYRFDLTGQSNFSLALQTSDWLTVELYDSNGSYIQGSKSDSGSDPFISRTLNAGTYYVRVASPYSVGSDTTFGTWGTYNLSLAAAPIVPDYAGNSYSTARAITVGSTASTYSDWIGISDTSDYYRFSLSNNSNLSLALSGLSTDTTMDLLNSNGVTIAGAVPGSTAKSMSQTLAAGTYYVRLMPKSGTNTYYNFSLTAAPIVDYAGNSLSAARAITVGPTPSTYRDWVGVGDTSNLVGTGDTNDYYRFSLSNNSNFSLALNGLSVDTNVQLLDSYGSVIQGSSAGGTTAESMSRTLNAGTYYVRVYPASAINNYNTYYNLSLTAAAIVPDYAGNSLSAARAITVGSTASTYSDWVGTADTNDYYRFSLSNNSNFSLALNGLTADANVQLLDSYGNVIQGSAALGTTAESISRTLNAGTYYVRAYPTSGANTNYNLSLTATPSLPAITVAATDASAAETLSGQTANPGAFTITRTGSTASALTVYYTVGGTATKGIDYSNLTGSVTISAGATTAILPINVIDDSLAENSETAVVTLASNAAYSLGSASSSTVTITDNDDWFAQNIKDVALQSAARSRATDNILNRNEMIAIFRDAQDGSVIDATELTDLRTLVSNASRFNMTDPVRVLSNKIVNGNVANARYQGASLGNLYAGSSSTQMENLIRKWFLGIDRPTAAYTYQYASGSLFQNGVSYQDIKQGAVGDCYLLASLAAAAFRTPSTIQSMFTDNGDNTYTVRLYNNGVADYVTVDKYLPVSGADFAYAKGGAGSYSSTSNELWVALAEKAYAQINESGWIGQDNANRYHISGVKDSGIAGGLGYHAMRHATGRQTSYVYHPNGGITDTNAIIQTFNANQLITIGSKESGVASNVAANHEYTLVGYNSSTQRFTLFNPWGVNGGYDSSWTFKPGIIELTASQMTANFNYWAYTTSNTQPQYSSSTSTLPAAKFMS